MYCYCQQIYEVINQNCHINYYLTISPCYPIKTLTKWLGWKCHLWHFCQKMWKLHPRNICTYTVMKFKRNQNCTTFILTYTHVHMYIRVIYIRIAIYKELTCYIQINCYISYTICMRPKTNLGFLSLHVQYSLATR